MIAYAEWMQILLLLPLLAMAAEQPAVDWDKVNPETLQHYSALLRIDTRNPPGNETKAVDYLRSVLDKEGIPYQVFALDPNRANLVARIKGSGRKRPLLIMGHLDTVGIQKEKWTVDPFGAVRKDGYIYGRGAQDDKDNLTACLMVTLLLKRMNILLDRDVIFVAEAGEEGTSKWGIDFLVSQHWDAIAAEYALAEGPGGVSQNGRVRSMSFTTTEKVPRGVKLVARGVASHGSIPTLNNPVIHLAAAVGRIGAWQPPMRLNDTTRAYFEKLATVSSPEKADRYNHLTDKSRSEEIQRYLLEHEPEHNSLLRTSVVPTMINAGFRSNVIPSEAEATLDIRALPDEDMPRFYDLLRGVIADPAIEIVPNVGGRPAGKPSGLDTEMYHALEAVTKRLYPGAVPMPGMLTGATDMAQIRAKGTAAYGIGPVIDEKDTGSHGAHSDDERLAEKSLYQFVEFTFRAVLEVAAAR